ncbi:maestro heat-like repeat-containing protein family member 7 [Nycticebus coucang]|uniref:maestro heat-like repeat-containing protein family member 7 n=1 Tax=Nycticebus coucang TaxID=9470 RepID=UPI00234E127B|nr:maestro heat-like repeat-containing protein family member 7 [Nycticebus coucang]
MNVISDLSKLEPVLESDSIAEVLLTCCDSVLCLPPSEGLQEAASDPTEELLRRSLQSLQRLMVALVTERPTQIQSCLELLETWLNSQKDHERERAMSCASYVLSFTLKMNNFKGEIQFTRLGHLVRMLAIHCQDPVDSICILSAEAVYSLYCVLLLQKKMSRKSEKHLEEEAKREAYSANTFYKNTFQIGRAFGGCLTQSQLYDLVLEAMEGLSNSKAKLSLAAAQLMSAVIKERGRNLIKVEEIAEGILQWLSRSLKPRTKEETLQAMCSLAGSNTCSVIPMLLSKPLPWDSTTLAVWKAFGPQRDTALNVLQLLTDFLEMSHYREDTGEMDAQPVVVTCALREMLSGPLCQEAVQEFFPQLLLAVLSHLYGVTKQNVPWKMEGGPSSQSWSLDPTKCALEVAKLLLLAAAHEEVLIHANEHHCWDLLSGSASFYVGAMDLARAIVRVCEPSLLHRFLSHVHKLLYSVDEGRKILGMAFYVQLLWHPTVAHTLGQVSLSTLTHWLKDPSIIMQEISLQGISNLALHPENSKALKRLVPFLRGFLDGEVRVTVQAVRSLQNIIHHGKNKDIQGMFCSICQQLRPLINDEREPVRIAAISALGYMLRRDKKYKARATMKRELCKFLLPLLLNVQQENSKVVKVCGEALSEWAKVIGWVPLTGTFQHITLSNHLQVIQDTCAYLVRRGKQQLMGDLLSQSLEILGNPQTSLKAAALTVIGCTVKHINTNNMHEEDVQVMRSALERLERDEDHQVRSLAQEVLAEVSDPASQLPTSRRTIMGIKVPGRKVHLVKGKRGQKNCWQHLQESFRRWHQGRL